MRNDETLSDEITHVLINLLHLALVCHCFFIRRQRTEPKFSYQTCEKVSMTARKLRAERGRVWKAERRRERVQVSGGWDEEDGGEGTVGSSQKKSFWKVMRGTGAGVWSVMLIENFSRYENLKELILPYIPGWSSRNLAISIGFNEQLLLVLEQQLGFTFL